MFVDGTGKHEPISKRLQKLREEVRKLFGLERIHNIDELEYKIYEEAMKLKKEKSEMEEKEKIQEAHIKNYEEKLNELKLENKLLS